MIVVVDPAQVGELEVPRQRRGLAGDPFHHAAVAGQRIDIIIEQLEARAIEVAGKPAGGDGHPDTGGHPLPQRAGGRLDTRGPAVFRVAGAFAVELPKALDVVQGHRQLAQHLVLGIDRFDAGEVQQGIEQRRGVPNREHEAVAVGPDRVLRVKAQEVLPQAIDHGRERHRRTRMAGVGLLDRVHREGTDRIDRQLHHLLVCHGCLLSHGLTGCLLPGKPLCPGAAGVARPG